MPSLKSRRYAPRLLHTRCSSVAAPLIFPGRAILGSGSLGTSGRITATTRSPTTGRKNRDRSNSTLQLQADWFPPGASTGFHERRFRRPAAAYVRCARGSNISFCAAFRSNSGFAQDTHFVAQLETLLKIVRDQKRWYLNTKHWRREEYIRPATAHPGLEPAHPNSSKRGGANQSPREASSVVLAAGKLVRRRRKLRRGCEIFPAYPVTLRAAPSAAATPRELQVLPQVICEHSA